MEYLHCFLRHSLYQIHQDLYCHHLCPDLLIMDYQKNAAIPAGLMSAPQSNSTLVIGSIILSSATTIKPDIGIYSCGVYCSHTYWRKVIFLRTTDGRRCTINAVISKNPCFFSLRRHRNLNPHSYRNRRHHLHHRIYNYPVCCCL